MREATPQMRRRSVAWQRHLDGPRFDIISSQVKSSSLCSLDLFLYNSLIYYLKLTLFELRQPFSILRQTTDDLDMSNIDS